MVQCLVIVSVIYQIHFKTIFLFFVCIKGFDIFISNGFNSSGNSYSDFCDSYFCPNGYTLGAGSRAWLAGSISFSVYELEVFQIPF